MKIDNLMEGIVIKRPSKYIKTPYVADVLINSQNIENFGNIEVLAHSGSLGCCGLADKDATILLAPIINKNTSKTNTKEIIKTINDNDDENIKEKQHCTYRIYLSILNDKNNEIIIGIHPKLAEDLTELSLQNNLLSKLKNIKNYRRETKIYVEGKVDSRFDFTGIDENNIPFIMEVKNVPLADYEDITSKERKKKNYDNRDFNSKVAYFPDGYRKKTTDPVSPRALKHIRELTLIKKESKTRCIMCYVIQRTDVDRFQISVIDQEYRNAVKYAIECGVEIITLVVSWNKNGEAYFIRDDLPITSFD